MQVKAIQSSGIRGWSTAPLYFWGCNRHCFQPQILHFWMKVTRQEDFSTIFCPAKIYSGQLRGYLSASSPASELTARFRVRVIELGLGSGLGFWVALALMMIIRARVN